MSTRKTKERERRKQARIQAGKVLAGVTPAPPREEVIRQMMRGFDAAVADVRKLLAAADRILTIRRCRGLLAGLSGK